jgi:hypothetical protein
MGTVSYPRHDAAAVVRAVLKAVNRRLARLVLLSTR